MALFVRRIWLIFACMGIGTLTVSAQQMPWVVASLEEIDLASPVVGAATFPISLARSVMDAVPEKYRQEALESGFDIETIEQAVIKMPYGETFSMTENGYRLVIRKLLVPMEGVEAKPSMLMVENDTINLPIPLTLTDTAIGIVTMQINELKGQEAQLREVIRHLEQTPPGVLLTGADYLTNSWLRISLR